ncbi:hypothetical protein VPH35_036778 [Triticum aestivum]
MRFPSPPPLRPSHAALPPLRSGTAPSSQQQDGGDVPCARARRAHSAPVRGLPLRRRPGPCHQSHCCGEGHRGATLHAPPPPRGFLVYFDLPAHRDNAVRHDIIKVDVARFFIRAWHENDHASLMKLPLHIRVVVVNLPMQLWSLEGADVAFRDFSCADRLYSRTLQREGTPRLSRSWGSLEDPVHTGDMGAHAGVGGGAGRVDEILGFSPRIATSLRRRAFGAMIYRSTWTGWRTGPRSLRARRTLDRAAPSSSSGDNRPFTRTESGVWVGTVEDGQPDRRRVAPRLAAQGCGDPHARP